MELAVKAVQGADGLPFRGAAHDHLSALDLAGIEGMERLAGFKEDEVGDVHHVVDGLEAD